ncbi:MAG: hypothetical protein H0X66_00880 [Verrucomicrobia bacterium]|nr:hypothetical protein [Verrucomicrobiota bacterium]
MKANVHQYFAKCAAMLVALAMVWAGDPTAQAESIINSKHNLSASGPGTIKASTETEVCIFCHTPHRSSDLMPLWNHHTSAVDNYTPYSSTTLKATVGQPTGASKLCLSCHDGTVALGMVYSRTTPIAMQNSVTTMPDGPSNVGTDLSSDHPISFVYDSALAAAHGQLKDPSTLTERVRLDHNNEMQCTACHDPHNNQYGNFLVMDNTASAICITCHDLPGWSGSAHGTSTARMPEAASLNQALAEMASVKKVSSSKHTVADNACASCHVPHKSGSRQRLLKESREDQTCYTCHGGNSKTGKNIAAEFNKFSVHPVLTTSGLHDPMEDLINSDRHASCSDCHNTHFSTGNKAAAPNASGAILGTRGVSSGGTLVKSITKEYELCFRCHGDSLAPAPSQVPRQFTSTNARLKFSPSNKSFHPVVSPGRNPHVPSLIAPWTPSSMMKCTDCHNNDQAPAAGGTGPNGPHGSAHSPLLERNLTMVDFRPESPIEYALCYKCHDRSSILSDQSFKGHRKHIVDYQTSCTTCHDSHGASNPGLINFNTTYATPSSSGQLYYQSIGNRNSSCALTCHGKDHNPLSY